MSAKDELDRMIENLTAENNKNPVRNKTKTRFDDMSVDDIINSLSANSKPQKKPVEETGLMQKAILNKIIPDENIKPVEENPELLNTPPEELLENAINNEPEKDCVSEMLENIEKQKEENIQKIENQSVQIQEDEFVDLPEPDNIELESFINPGKIETILDEPTDELAETKKEEPEFDEETDVTVINSKKTIYTILGIIWFIFALIGLIFTVNYGIKYFRSFTSGDDRKSDFINAVYPAVIMDIEAFDNGNELSSQQVITASIWKLIMSGDIDKYDRTFDVISVPAVDIEAVASKLFNTEFPEIEHQTVGSGDLKFYYNTETKSYNVPCQPMLFSYEPRISAISKDGDIYTVEVEYLQEQPSWMKNNSNFNSDVSKVVKFKIQPNDDDYSILSMQIVQVNQNN